MTTPPVAAHLGVGVLGVLAAAPLVGAHPWRRGDSAGSHAGPHTVGNFLAPGSLPCDSSKLLAPPRLATAWPHDFDEPRAPGRLRPSPDELTVPWWCVAQASRVVLP